MTTPKRTFLPTTFEDENPGCGDSAQSVSEEATSSVELSIPDVFNESRESYGFEESTGGDAFASGSFI